MLTYITKEQYNFFYKQGYLLIKNLYDETTFFKIRQITENAWRSKKWKEPFYNTDNITTHIYNFFPELVDLIFTEKYIGILKELLGPKCVMVVEPAIHRNTYGGWHKDSSYLSLQGETFHLNDDFCCAQTAIYLQSNHIKYAGGLTVIPKTQGLPNRFTHIYNMNFSQRAKLKIQKTLGISIFDKLDNDENITDISSEAGDLIVFNYSIDHKGTTPIEKDIRGDKYVIFNAFVNKPHYADKVSAGLKKMPSQYSQKYLAQNYTLTNELKNRAEQLNIGVQL